MKVCSVEIILMAPQSVQIILIGIFQGYSNSKAIVILINTKQSKVNPLYMDPK